MIIAIEWKSLASILCVIALLWHKYGSKGYLVVIGWTSSKNIGLKTGWTRILSNIGSWLSEKGNGTLRFALLAIRFIDGRAKLYLFK